MVVILLTNSKFGNYQLAKKFKDQKSLCSWLPTGRWGAVSCRQLRHKLEEASLIAFLLARKLCGAQQEIVNGAWEGKATMLRRKAAWGTRADVQKQPNKVALDSRPTCALHGAPHCHQWKWEWLVGSSPPPPKYTPAGGSAPAQVLYGPAPHLWTHTMPPTAISASSTRDKELILGFISRKTSEVKESFSQQQAFSLQWLEVISRTHFLAHHSKINSWHIAHGKQRVWLGVLEVLPCDESLLRGCWRSWDIQHEAITRFIFRFWANGEVSVFSWRRTCCSHNHCVATDYFLVHCDLDKQSPDTAMAIVFLLLTVLL